jgi:hypothetical protein
MSIFKIDGATIRLNPGQDVAVALAMDGAVASIGGIITLCGNWTRETASITGCIIINDPSLPPGTIVIEPSES